MKVSDLEDVELDYWVAKAVGAVADRSAVMLTDVVPFAICEGDGGDAFRPSSIWGHGGPIIEREQITLYADAAAKWEAQRDSVRQQGHTPLIAAMRCFVASKFGEEVPDAC